jgi:ribonuclease P protein component
MCATPSSIAATASNPLLFSKERRILRSADFRLVYESGTRMSCRYFTAFCLKRDAELDVPARVGFTIPRAVGKAVVRNKIRRRMREAMILVIQQLPDNWNIVVNPRRTVLDASFTELCREASRVVNQCVQAPRQRS